MVLEYFENNNQKNMNGSGTRIKNLGEALRLHSLAGTFHYAFDTFKTCKFTNVLSWFKEGLLPSNVSF